MKIRRSCAAFLGLLVLTTGCASSDEPDTATPAAAAASAAPTEEPLDLGEDPIDPEAATDPEEAGLDPDMPQDRDPACELDEVNAALCAFVEAVLYGDTASLSAGEQEIVPTMNELPGGWYELVECVLVGDVTVECPVTFDPGGPQETTATFALAPTNAEFNDGGLYVEPGETLDYDVVEYLGML